MKIFPAEPNVNLYEEGFEQADILGRARVGKALSDLVERIEDPMVVALDGHWGTGKTYFLKRWVGAHRIENEGKATTVYFDAFANDYLSDPLPALVSAMGERFPERNGGSMDGIKAAAFKIVKPLARIGLAMATAGATSVLGDLGDAAANAASGEASAALENYWRQEEGRRAAMEEFRSSLEKLVAAPQDDGGSSDTETSSANGARLVIVVDELDRCRPDYALEVLEVMKHFFSVPGVIFVLGVNLAALENSVKARYGNDMDASAYLRKFINVSLTLPNTICQHRETRDAVAVYLDHQISEMGIPEHIANRLRLHIQLISRNNRVSIRDVAQILAAVSLLGKGILDDSSLPKGWIDVTVALIVSKVIRPEFHMKLLGLTFDRGGLESYLGSWARMQGEKRMSTLSPDDEYYAREQYNLWMFLAQDGKLENEDITADELFHRMLFRPGYPLTPRSVPRIAYRDWLDLFSVTTA